MGRIRLDMSYFAGFTATNYPNNVLWLDAQDPTTLVLSGSDVITWNDKSGLSNNATGVGPPTTGANINGHNAIQHSNNYFTAHGVAPYLTTQPLTFASVLQNDALTFRRWFGASAGVGTDRIRASLNSNTPRALTLSSGSATLATGNVVSSSQIGILFVVIAGNTLSAWWDGSLVINAGAFGVGGHNVLDLFYIGAGDAASMPWSGKYGEFAVWQSDLTSDLAAVETALATKWGI